MLCYVMTLRYVLRNGGKTQSVKTTMQKLRLCFALETLEMVYYLISSLISNDVISE